MLHRRKSLDQVVQAINLDGAVMQNRHALAVGRKIYISAASIGRCGLKGGDTHPAKRVVDINILSLNVLLRYWIHGRVGVHEPKRLDSKMRTVRERYQSRAVLVWRERNSPEQRALQVIAFKRLLVAFDARCRHEDCVGYGLNERLAK